VRIKVNADKCQGHARCFALLPEVFAVDDYGQSSVRGDGVVAPEFVAKAKLAVANCPEFAIEVLEAD
jgi:ferredoxin